MKLIAMLKINTFVNVNYFIFPCVSQFCKESFSKFLGSSMESKESIVILCSQNICNDSASMSHPEIWKEMLYRIKK